MLDGVHAGFKGDPDSLGALDVRHDGQAVPMRRLACGAGDVERHAQHAGFAGFGCIEDAAGDEELDNVRTAFDEVEHLVRGVLRGRGDAGEEAGSVAAGDGDARTRGDDARADVSSGVDVVADR